MIGWPRKGTSTKRVLVVEDSPGIRRLIEVSLRPIEVELIARSDGPSGLAAIRREAPDLVVLDIGLPGMDGWEVLKHLREAEETASLPVVVLTAHAEEESRRRADEGGADAFITKPFHPQAFRSAVAEFLSIESE